MKKWIVFFFACLVLLGFWLLIIAGFPVLFFNEGSYVDMAKALDEGEGACVEVESNAEVDPDMNGKLVHMTGRAETDDILSDDTFGVSTKAIRLTRRVEMYQWIEHSKTTEKKKLGGKVEKTTVYTYSKDWSEELIPSTEFKESGHENPGSMEFSSETKYAENVRFGAFRLNDKQVKRMGDAMTYAFPASFTCKVDRVQVQGATIYVPEVTTRENRLNVRKVAAMPRIGDMRVTFKVVYPHDVSLVAKQKGDTFVGYTAKTGKKVDLFSDDVKDAAEMFASARSGNSLFTWIVRIGGFLMMFIGISMILKPLSVLRDVLPILGDIVEMGAGVVAFLVALVCAFATIAVAWLFYRPVIGVILLAAAGSFAYWLHMKRRAAKGAAAPAPQPR